MIWTERKRSTHQENKEEKRTTLILILFKENSKKHSIKRLEKK